MAALELSVNPANIDPAFGMNERFRKPDATAFGGIRFSSALTPGLVRLAGHGIFPAPMENTCLGPPRSDA